MSWWRRNPEESSGPWTVVAEIRPGHWWWVRSMGQWEKECEAQEAAQRLEDLSAQDGKVGNWAWAKVSDAEKLLDPQSIEPRTVRRYP